LPNSSLANLVQTLYATASAFLGLAKEAFTRTAADISLDELAKAADIASLHSLSTNA